MIIMQYQYPIKLKTMLNSANSAQTPLELSLFEICQIEVSRGISKIIRAMEFCKCRYDP